jgi:acetylornithine deacetylase/succinyl-diaminopimelate desuccinylase-like protein
MNWTAVTEEATGTLQALLRFNTTNPPGNETPCIEYIAAALKHEGIEPLVFESAPGRGNLVARLKGDGSLPPLLLMGHVDVVPAEEDKWRHSPFSGDLEDGIVWGRGATDMKQMVTMVLMTMLLLKRQAAAKPRHQGVRVCPDEV